MHYISERCPTADTSYLSFGQSWYPAADLEKSPKFLGADLAVSEPRPNLDRAAPQRRRSCRNANTELLCRGVDIKR